MTKGYDKLTMLVKLILQIFFGYIISPAYRIIKGIEKGDAMLIIFGIIALIPIFWLIDIITIILTNRISILA